MTTETLIGRVVIRGRPPWSGEEAQEVFDIACRDMITRGVRTRYLLTPARFLWLGFPEGEVPLGWKSDPSAFFELSEFAHEEVDRVISGPTLDLLKQVADVVTVGVDIHTEAGEASNTTPHIELVGVYDLKNETLDWTGKSYPTSRQENHLVHCTDLGSHLMDFGEDRLLVLGCHDLNMWSPRARAAMGSQRRARADEMDRLATDFRPTAVLHHPHTTQSPRVWTQGWSGLRKALPTVKAYASAIQFVPDLKRSLQRVLEQTRMGETADVVVDWSLDRPSLLE